MTGARSPWPRSSRRSGAISRYLQSTRNLVGSALGLGGVGLYAAGYAGRYWVLVVAGLYGAGALLTPADRRVDLGGSGSGPADERDLLATLDGLRRRLRRETLPTGVEGRLQYIAGVVEGLLARPADLAAQPESWFEVDSAVRTDLPVTFEAYLNLPRWYAGRRMLPGAGRSAEAELVAQLDSITKLLTKTAERVYGGHERWMVEHGRRLAERAGDLPPD